jgi:Carboxypeptidase regulatory-like domain/TonB dependent receptor-like, beta-barrel
MVRLMVVLCAASVAAFAQIGTSTITGRVTDASGAVIPGVSVSIVQKSTNFKNLVETNSEGIYRVPSLQPGEYTVTFEMSGFMKIVRDGVELRTGDTLALDASLQVGQVTEAIEVQGAAALLETETSATRTVVSGSVLYEMPLYQRYINSTLNLVPGMSSGGFAYGGDLGAYHLAGQRSGAIGIFEDGVVGSDPQGGTATIKPLQNSIAEVNVITTVPSAEYGHSAGGVISAVKKSGTNELHGMASWYGRTRNMQHRRYFDRARTSDPSPGRPDGVPVFFMMPDANVGGPVYIPGLYDGRNKTFFFFGYQRLHEKKVAQIFTSTPTPAMRQGIFTFPGANPIYDPATTRRNADGTWARDPFPGNTIPLTRFDPVARKVLEYDPWVQPNQAGTFTSTGPNNNLLADEFARVFFNDYNLRIDHQFSTTFKLYGSYTQNDGSGYGRPILIREDRLEFDAVQGNYNPSRVLNSSLGYTWVATPRVVNDSRVGYFRRKGTDRQVPSYGEDWAGKLGIPNVSPELMPSFGIYNITGANPERAVNETLSFRNDTTWIRGSHAYKFGYEILRYRLNSAIFARFASFMFDFVTAGLQPNGATLPNTGITFAGFLTGYVRQGTFNSELTSWLPRSDIHSFYIQDDWRITRRLTANLGLRYSNESPFGSKYGKMTNFDPTAVDDLTGKLGAFIHPTEGLSARDSNNFNPRLGLSWHPFEKWVFRGGIGMYTIDVRFPQSRGQFEEYVATANQQAAPGDPTPIYQISRGPDPVQFTVRPDGTSPFVGTNYGSRNAEWLDPNLRNPYVANFNGSVQYEFKPDYLLELSYQGSSGVGLVERWQYNTFPIDYFAGNPAQQTAVFAAPQNYRPYTHFGDIRFRSNVGHSTFHSGTVKLEKRLSKGLYFSTFYTYSKAIDSQDGDNDGNGVAPIQNRSLEKARSGFDRTHRFIGLFNYELPFGPGKRWATTGWQKWLLGGLELSWIQTLESGNPVNFGFAGSPFNYWPSFAGSQRPDVVNRPGVRDDWYEIGEDRFTTGNTNSVFGGGNNGLANFTYPGGCGTSTTIPPGFDRTRCDFRIGNAGRNIATGLPLRWSQVSVQKNFHLGERYNIQIRWDMQNAFKTYNFNTPNTTVDFRNPAQFGKVSSDPTTASLGGQPLMNLTVMIQF